MPRTRQGQLGPLHRPHPVQADILNLVFQSPGGTFLGNQKVSIAPGGGGPFHD